MRGLGHGGSAHRYGPLAAPTLIAALRLMRWFLLLGLPVTYRVAGLNGPPRRPGLVEKRQAAFGLPYGESCRSRFHYQLCGIDPGRKYANMCGT